MAAVKTSVENQDYNADNNDGSGSGGGDGGIDRGDNDGGVYDDDISDNIRGWDNDDDDDDDCSGGGGGGGDCGCYDCYDDNDTDGCCDNVVAHDEGDNECGYNNGVGCNDYNGDGSSFWNDDDDDDDEDDDEDDDMIDFGVNCNDKEKIIMLVVMKIVVKVLAVEMMKKIMVMVV